MREYFPSRLCLGSSCQAKNRTTQSSGVRSLSGILFALSQSRLKCPKGPLAVLSTTIIPPSAAGNAPSIISSARFGSSKSIGPSSETWRKFTALPPRPDVSAVNMAPLLHLRALWFHVDDRTRPMSPYVSSIYSHAFWTRFTSLSVASDCVWSTILLWKFGIFKHASS